MSKRKTKKRITEEARIGTRCENVERVGDLSTTEGVEQRGGGRRRRREGNGEEELACSGEIERRKMRVLVEGAD